MQIIRPDQDQGSQENNNFDTEPKVGKTKLEAEKDTEFLKMEMDELKKSYKSEEVEANIQLAGTRTKDTEIENDTEEKRNRNFNAYAINKTITHGLLDFALLTTNVSQMKYILQVGERHPHYLLLIICISLSFMLQVIVGILLLVVGNGDNLQTRTDKLNRVITILIFFITVFNVVISGFNMEVTGPSLAACKKFLFRNFTINATQNSAG